MWISAEGAAVAALNRLSVDMRQEGILAVRRLSVQWDLEYEVEVFERLRADPSFVQARAETSRWSTVWVAASSIEVPCARATLCTVASVVAPMPRVGVLTMRRKATSSLGFVASLR